MDDVIHTTNEWLDILINGDTNIDGLKDRLAIAFPNKSITVDVAEDGYLLPGQTNWDRELQNPVITISEMDSVSSNLFYGDAVPNTGEKSYLGWGEDISLRFDVWGRTPPETKDIVDELKGLLKLMKRQLWSQMRVQLDASSQVNNPVEKENSLPQVYRKYISANLKVFKVKEVV